VEKFNGSVDMKVVIRGGGEGRRDRGWVFEIGKEIGCEGGGEVGEEGEGVDLKEWSIRKKKDWRVRCSLEVG
jgi:hypothetical protein